MPNCQEMSVSDEDNVQQAIPITMCDNQSSSSQTVNGISHVVLSPECMDDSEVRSIWNCGYHSWCVLYCGLYFGSVLI